MDNDREVEREKPQSTDLVERSKQVFLREIVNEFQRKQQQYDVGEEFAKTKRNRSLLVPLTILGLVVVFGVVVVAVTQYIQRTSRAVQVDVQDFQDVNLREVLDEAQRLQNQLNAAQRELEQVREEYQNRIEQVRRTRDRNIELLQEQGLTATQRQNREQQIRAEAQSQIESLDQEYQPRIAEIEDRIERLRQEIAEYDSRQLEQAREQEEVLNNQERVHELEMQQQREEYETRISELRTRYENEIAELEEYQQEFARTLRERHQEEIARLRRRYNPTFDPEGVGELLGVSETSRAQAFDGIEGYSAVLAENSIVASSEFSEIEQQYDAVGRLVDRLQQVPYENSVPAALAQIENRTRDVIAGFEEIRFGLEETVIDRDAIIAARESTIEEQQERIDEFLFALDEFARVNGDTGYILDPRDTANVVVYISRIRNVTLDSVGYVFRRDDEFVGTIRFVRREGRVIARVVDTAEGMQVRAFDKVLIDVQ